ncbi:hypothetical protein SLE2022_139270 [Rubroshorea leprosula]
MSQNLIKPATIFTAKPPPICYFLFFIILCILGFYALHFPPRIPQNAALYRQMFLSSGDNYTLYSYLRALTQHPHLAGTKPSLDTANYVKTHFQTLGLETHVVPFKALLSYPLHASVALHFRNGTELKLPLNEVGISGYAVSGLVQPYHAYSPSGSAHAKVVFVNYGREEDYRALAVRGVDVNGCIVIARKGDDLGRGAVVEIGEAKGALAVLIYADGDRSRGGFGTGVERGTVMRGVGDPQSPGWPGIEDGEKLGLQESEVLSRFPRIPSLPLPFETAQIILESLGGGLMPQEWRDSGQSRFSGVGPGPVMLNFTYQGEKKLATIYNVFAVIRGSEEPDRYVLLGNHRDAWTYGAVDPNSGTSALLDIARRYALLMRKGWNPRRTIVLCSWDAEEFGMIGSTEWVEQHLINLGAKAVAYLNVDCAVQGPGFFVGATPQLDNLIFEVTKKIKDPDSEGATVYEKWTTINGVKNIQRLNSVDSDFVPFLQHAGVPSVDIYYGSDVPVYHTAFDSFDWMINNADPFFHRHLAVTGIWGLLALHLADDSILPFNYHTYADQLKEYKDVLSGFVDNSISVAPLTASIEELYSAAKQAEDEAKRLMEQEAAATSIILKMRALNDRLLLAEKGFLDPEGLKGRQWFKHLVYGPCNNHESKLVFFPGIADSIQESTRMRTGDEQKAIQHEIWKVARAIQRAAGALRGELS